MNLCLEAAGHTLVVAIQAFSLLWIHSVERTEWREEWAIEGDRLRVVEAAVSATGAGMEIPDGAVLQDGAWHYRPDLPPQARVAFADAGRADSDWTLCAKDTCVSLRSVLPVRGEGFVMQACDRPGVPLEALPVR